VANENGREYGREYHAMKLANFVNLDILLSPINWLIIIGVAFFVPFAVAVIAKPPQNPIGNL
jgi:hypothetical protein